MSDDGDGDPDRLATLILLWVGAMLVIAVALVVLAVLATL